MTNEVEPRSVQENSLVVISFEGVENSSNITVYLGYANNPFGPSIRIHHNKNENWTNNISIPKLDGGKQEILKPDDMKSKRSIANLYYMVECATGCNPINYNGYGCYCGFSGSGMVVDSIDRCCKIHDNCYSATKCFIFLNYLVHYYWTCCRGEPLCAMEYSERSGPSSCTSQLCDCDKQLAVCLSNYPCPSERALCTS